MFSDTSIGLSVICNPCSATPLRSYTPWSTSNPSQPRLPHHPPAWTSGATELKKKTIKTKCSLFVLKQFCVWLCFETILFSYMLCYHWCLRDSRLLYPMTSRCKFENDKSCFFYRNYPKILCPFYIRRIFPNCEK